MKGHTKILHANGTAYQISIVGDASWDGWGKAKRYFDTFELLP